ncbi:hypothetical protein [Gloeocapsa sp. PCC 73106]|uniref:hypothetical protein n=1 Tax=Gloeocapsa sp. PCC 73106 TaxID=102232 RepID=UPI0002AC123A|nr:hypothetical protein [Gloeocapsa sp. PCC 73106]ELR97451.1 hypothetical protein GLO73106DRAFT_00012610 [Gloeocapsa sp. PCC 73106]
MSESLENTTVTAQEIADLIEEFEQYRIRLVEEMEIAAQRAKQSKQKAMAQIEPELAKVDAALQNLRDRQASMNQP